MKKTMVWLLSLLLMMTLSLPAFAAEGNVIYDGRAGEFLFEPGSDYSPTDLFPNFKDAMPGDTLSQRITVKNERDGSRVEIWMRALGAHEASEEFLSQLRLRVVQEEETELFDAPADETAQLTDWVSLGKFWPGTETTLNVTLEIPVELDNCFAYAVGYLDWEFRVLELSGGGGETPDKPLPDEPLPEEPQPEGPPVPEEPQPDTPHTGDAFQTKIWLAMTVIGGAMTLCLLLILLKQDKHCRKK